MCMRVRESVYVCVSVSMGITLCVRAHMRVCVCVWLHKQEKIVTIDCRDYEHILF